MISRALALAAGVVYLLAGGWAFLFPAGFYSAIANFSPYNRHLLHDVGAFQVGFGVVLLAAAFAGRGLVPALVGVLAGSLLHLASHVEDLGLGGHPATDLVALTLLAAALAVALLLELRGRRGSDRP
jgi:uncharacterized protein YjeT (DUF2065 family)